MDSHSNQNQDWINLYEMIEFDHENYINNINASNVLTSTLEKNSYLRMYIG